METEIRGFIDNPEEILAIATENGVYDLEDVFYLPKGIKINSLTDTDPWHPRNQTLRHRTFTPVGCQVVFSMQKYSGAVKQAKKFIMANGDAEDLREMLDSLGFQPAVAIKRRVGHFLSLEENPGVKFVIEDIEKVGWMFEGHVDPGEEDWLLGKLGVGANGLIYESLPALYYNKYIKE